MVVSTLAHADGLPPNYLKGCFYPLVPNSPCEQEAKKHPDWTRQWVEQREKMAQAAPSAQEVSPPGTGLSDPIADLRKACGADYDRVQSFQVVGMSWPRVKQCAGGTFEVVSQLNRADGVLTTYRQNGIYIYELKGVVVGIERF
jgi:hypothetical protein